VGTRLLDHARAQVVDLGWTPVLDVVASAVPAISLSRLAGWNEIGRIAFAVTGQNDYRTCFRGTGLRNGPLPGEV